MHGYKAMLYLGCVLGIYAGAPVAAHRRLDAATFGLVVVVLLVPAFLGSRLLYVLRHGGAFWRDEGGSALFGGLVLSFAVSVVVVPAAGLAFWPFWDAASVTMLVGLAVTRVGCLMNGCCCGRPTTGRFGMWLPNVAGHWQRRVPTQLLESGLAAVILAGLVLGGGALHADGAVAAAVVSSYCAGRVVIQAMREPLTTRHDPSRYQERQGSLVVPGARTNSRNSPPEGFEPSHTV